MDTDPKYVGHCHALLKDAGQRYPLPEYLKVTGLPCKVLHDYGRNPVALYAQLREGDSKYIALGGPNLFSYLEQLAAEGVGRSRDVDGVRYMFLLSKRVVPLPRFGNLGEIESRGC